MEGKRGEVAKEDLILLNHVVNMLKERYNIKDKDIAKLISGSDDSIPINIFKSKQLTTFEALVKYLKENRSLGFKQIADILKRKNNTIWATYKKATKKRSSPFTITHSELDIPLSLFKKRASVLKTIVQHLKDSCNLTYHQIALLLARNDRTIWTVYNRK